MEQIGTEMVQPGWEVWSSDGERLGKVVQIEGQTLTIKKEGILGGEIILPRASIKEVEEGRVEVSMTKQEATT